MKKIVFGTLMSLMVFSFTVSYSFAAGRYLRYSRRISDCINEHQQNFVDENSDGICDNQGKMMHRNCENHNAFVDGNDDGLCDHYESTENRGRRQHHRTRHH